MSFDEDDLAWAEEAWDAYHNATKDLHQSLNTVLSHISCNPDDALVRKRRMYRPPLFVVDVPGDDAWVVIWRPGDEVPEIHYVGPDPF